METSTFLKTLLTVVERSSFLKTLLTVVETSSFLKTLLTVVEPSSFLKTCLSFGKSSSFLKPCLNVIGTSVRPDQFIAVHRAAGYIHSVFIILPIYPYRAMKFRAAILLSSPVLRVLNFDFFHEEEKTFAITNACQCWLCFESPLKSRNFTGELQLELGV